MKTKIHKKFNEFLDEASKPQWLRNDLGKMRKRGRITILVDKIRNGARPKGWKWGSTRWAPCSPAARAPTRHCRR